MKNAPKGSNPPNKHIAHVCKYQGMFFIYFGTTLYPTGFYIAYLLNPTKLPMKTKGTDILNHIATIINITENLIFKSYMKS